MRFTSVRNHETVDGRRPALSTYLLTGVVCFFPLQGSSSQSTVRQNLVQRTRTELEQWVETRRLISREKRDWSLGQELLLDRIDLLRDSSVTLKSKQIQAETRIAEVSKVRARLQAKAKELRLASATLEEVVDGLEARVLILLGKLPHPLRETVKPLSQRIDRNIGEDPAREDPAREDPAREDPVGGSRPEKSEKRSKVPGSEKHSKRIEGPGKKKLSLAQRFMTIVGILNEVDKFNREIHVGSEVMTLPSGQTAEVKTLYIGISCGYYVTPKGDAAGVGASTKNGWSWVAANDSSQRVAEAIAVFLNEKSVRYVKLPIQIR